MNQKDFNALLNNITTLIIPLNQLLYECLIIIILYYLFNALEFRNVGLHKPFIYLIAIIFIGLDWSRVSWSLLQFPSVGVSKQVVSILYI